MNQKVDAVRLRIDVGDEITHFVVAPLRVAEENEAQGVFPSRRSFYPGDVADVYLPRISRQVSVVGMIINEFTSCHKEKDGCVNG